MMQESFGMNAAERYIAGMYWFRRPILTIVVPVFNVAGFLDSCLESIRGQRFTDYECLLIDDGSTDGSGEICNRYACRDRRFRVFHTKNRGLSEARNYGTTLAQGLYLTYVDADDLIETSYLEDLYNVMKASGADIVCVQEREEAACADHAACTRGCGEIREASGAQTCKSGNGRVKHSPKALHMGSGWNESHHTLSGENLSETVRKTVRKAGRVFGREIRTRRRQPEYIFLPRWLALWFCIRGHSDVPLISAWGKLYRTEFAQQFFFPRGRNYEDLAETWQMVLHADRVAFCPYRDYVYRLREGSITHTKTLRNLYDYVWALESRSEGLKGNREEGQEGSRFGYLVGTASEILRFPGFYLDHIRDGLPIVDLYYRNIHAKPFGRVICRVYRFGMKHKAMMWKVRTLKRRVNHLLTGAPLGEGPGPEDWGNGTNVMRTSCKGQAKPD